MFINFCLKTRLINEYPCLVNGLLFIRGVGFGGDLLCI